MHKGKKCLIPGCNNYSDSRGLCFNDYCKAKRLVDKQRTTWKYLIEKGLAMPSKRYDGYAFDAFSKAFEAAKNPKPMNESEKNLAESISNDPPF